MDIEFLEPIKFSCEILDVEDHLSSIKIFFHVEACQFSHEIKYKGEIWIKFKSIDIFLSELIEKKEVSKLEDIDGNTFIKIVRHDNAAYFLWSARRRGIKGGLITSSFEANISEEVLDNIKESFIAFPKWW